jgi:hypothetical protein
MSTCSFSPAPPHEINKYMLVVWNVYDPRYKRAVVCGKQLLKNHHSIHNCVAACATKWIMTPSISISFMLPYKLYIV